MARKTIATVAAFLTGVSAACVSAQNSGMQQQAVPDRSALIPETTESIGRAIAERDPAFVIVLGKDGEPLVLQCAAGCRESSEVTKESFVLLDSGAIFWTKEGVPGGDPCMTIKTTSGAQYEKCW